MPFGKLFRPILEEDAVFAKFSCKDTTTMEPINALVESTEWSMLVKDKSALIEDISGQLSSIGIGSQGSDQCSRAEVFGPVKALVLVKNKGISDEGDRDISCYRLEEYAQTNYLHETKRPETREKLCFGTNHQLYNLGGGNIGHLHQIREFNDRIRTRVGHIIRTQCIHRPEDPNSISDQSKRHHWSSLGRGMVR